MKYRASYLFVRPQATPTQHNNAKGPILTSLMILRPPSRPLTPAFLTPPTPLLPRPPLPRPPLPPPTTSNPRTNSHLLISPPIPTPIPIISPPPRVSRPYHSNIHRKKENRDASEDDADYRSRGESVVTAVVVRVLWAAPAGKNV
jgi:hypothetical protein